VKRSGPRGEAAGLLEWLPLSVGGDFGPDPAEAERERWRALAAMAAENIPDNPPAESGRVVEREGDGFEVAACPCGCWYCGECCAAKGYALRSRLVPIVRTFRKPVMLTFTVDPALFDSPRDAFEYLKRKRCVSETMRALRDGGWLASDRWFSVVEWQKHTEQVHFHVLIDAKGFVPMATIQAAWSKWRPAAAGPAKPNRPAFGMVRYSAPKFADALHAARYVTKYLTKLPEHGFPAWVMAMGADTRIRRYSTSRGFWNNPQAHTPGFDERFALALAELRGKVGNAPLMATVYRFERAERANIAAAEMDVDNVTYAELGKACGPGEYVVSVREPGSMRLAIRETVTVRELQRMTYAERITTCGETCNVFELESVVSDRGECHTQRKWIGIVNVQAAELAALEDGNNPKRRRRRIHAASSRSMFDVVERAIGHRPRWLRVVQFAGNGCNAR
jgi:hypothetical protein